MGTVQFLYFDFEDFFRLRAGIIPAAIFLAKNTNTANVLMLNYMRK
jgi:hypothetical protein